MPRLNKVSLVGHLGSDPEIRTLQNNSRNATVNIATDDSYKNRETGERVQRTDWHRVVVWGNPLVDTIEKLAAKGPLKGTQVFIEGKLRTRKYTDANDVVKYTTEVIVTSFEGFQLLGKKAQGSAAPASAPAETAKETAPANDADVPF
jgi:single-strand DNA-binding protein